MCFNNEFTRVFQGQMPSVAQTLQLYVFRMQNSRASVSVLFGPADRVGGGVGSRFCIAIYVFFFKHPYISNPVFMISSKYTSNSVNMQQ